MTLARQLMPATLLAVLSSAAYSIGITKWAFWFDESYTSALVRQTPQDIISLTSVDVHPPLYYLVLKSWTAIFGLSSGSMRAMSAVFAVIAVVLLFYLLRRFCSIKVSFVVALVSALAPYSVRYAQEARMYTMSTALLVAATLVLVIQLQKPNKNKPWWLWAVYAVLASAAVYTHYFSILVFATHALYVLRIGGTVKVKNVFRTMWARINTGWLVAMFAAVALFAPWLPTLYKQTKSVNDGFWIPGINEASMVDILTNLILFRGTARASLLFFSFGATALAFVVYYFWIRKKLPARELNGLSLLLESMVVPMVLLFLLSSIPHGTSYFYSRYFAQYSLMFYAGLVLVGVYAVKYQPINKLLGWLLLLATVGALGVGTIRVYQGENRQNLSKNDSFEYVLGSHQPGEGILTTRFRDWYNISHYFGGRADVHYLDEGLGWGSLQPIYRQDGLSINEVGDITSSYEYIWIVTDSASADQLLPPEWKLQGEAIKYGDTTTSLFRLQK